MEKAVSLDLKPALHTSLGITSVGRSDTRSGHRYGPAVRPYYLIHFILAGSGTFKVRGVSYHLHAGQGFLIEPNYQTYYVADDHTPWSYVWMGFTGTYASELISNLAISEQTPIFNNTHYAELATCVNRVLQINPQTIADHLLANSYLLRFLSIIARSTIVSKTTDRTRSQYVEKAVNYLAHHVATVSVNQLAKAVNVDRSYLSNLFKQVTDLTPSQYIRTFRITKARHLLESSPLPIERIAEECGYGNANSFARAFKQIYGIPPRQYRKQTQ